jgi:caffeoyl-CoA O-methyltransferase
MSFVVPPEIDRYAEEHTTPHDELLAELARETKETLPSPGMLTGVVEGRLLELLVYASGARRILEIGTYSGYSALSMARALPPDGRIDTCEISERHAEVARRYFARSPDGEKIRLHLGAALETIPRLDSVFDFVFVDADKPNYENYYELVLPRLAPRGLIAFDNTLGRGRVVGDGDSDESTRALRELNDLLVADQRVTCVLLSVRDGVTLVRKRTA